jgi:hypothetical protein
MRYLMMIYIVLALLLAGCSIPSEMSPIDTASDIDETIIPRIENTFSDDGRQAVIMSRAPIGIFNEKSLFAFPIFIPMDDNYTEKELVHHHSRFAEIYRTVYPWNEETIGNMSSPEIKIFSKI